jgi:hypothetical protein
MGEASCGAGAGERGIAREQGRPLGREAGCGRVGRCGAGWAVRPGRFFFSFKTKICKIHSGALKQIGKLQMSYRWIRCEKYFK